MLRVHEYDTDYSLDIADFLPFILATKGLVKTSENLRKSLERLPYISLCLS